MNLRDTKHQGRMIEVGLALRPTCRDASDDDIAFGG